MLSAHKQIQPNSSIPSAFLETERLQLCQIRVADIPPLMILLQDPELIAASKGCDMPLSTNQLLAWVFSQNNAFNRGLACCYTLRQKQDTDLLGLMMIDATRTDRQELSYFLRPDHWRQGLMSEAGEAILNSWQAFQQSQTPLMARCHAENSASQSLLHHLGLQPNTPTDGEQQDWILFTLPSAI